MRILKVKQRSNENIWYVNENYVTEETDEQVLAHAHIESILEDLTPKPEKPEVKKEEKPEVKKVTKKVNKK
jgi:hypothetical protein